MLEGTLHPDFARVARAVASSLRREPGGAAVCVYHRGECVVDLWGGSRDAAGTPWTADTLALSFSTTKGVVSTLLHVLAERGLVDYEAPLARYWPELGAGGKHEISVRQALSHQAGLYGIRGMIEDAAQIFDWATMVRALEQATPAHAPGARHGYHAITYGWLIGELIQRVTRRSLGDLLHEELAGPLGLDGLFIGLPDAEHARCAQLLSESDPRREALSDRVERAELPLRRIGRLLTALRCPFDLASTYAAFLPRGVARLDFNSPEALRARVPAANGVFTARSLARLYAALAAGGTLGGVRLMSPDRVLQIARVQRQGLDRVLTIPMQWRLGYHRVLTMGARTLGAFGHYGMGGSGAFADPRRNLAVGFTVNVMGGRSLGTTRTMRIAEAAVRSADER